MAIAEEVATVAGAFLMGSLPAGLLIARVFYRTDIRQAGSGNIGAANALRTLGRGAGAAVLVLDALKAYVPTIVALRFGGQTLALAAAFAAIAGHCYSPWLGFRGGKGVATELGALFALCWPAGAIFVAVWIAVALASAYASVASLVATASACLPLWMLAGNRAGLYGIAVALLITWRHAENLKRLRNGNENRVRLWRRDVGASSQASNPGGLS